MQYNCSEKGNALKWPTQAVAMAVACCCVGQCNGMHRATHFDGKFGKYGRKNEDSLFAKDQNQLDTIYNKPKRKKDCSGEEQSFLNRCKKELLYLGNDSLECFGVIHGQVSENLAVDLDTSLVQKTHQLRIAQTLETSGSIDTLNPQ